MAVQCRASMPRTVKTLTMCQVDRGWERGSSTVAEFYDWTIVLTVDLACKGMNGKSMAAHRGVLLYAVLKGQYNRVSVVFR